MLKNLVLFCLLVNSTSTLKAQQTVTISSAEISFTFASKDVKGSISGFESSSIIHFDAWPGSKFKGSVAVETIKTGNFLRDRSLKGRKYFDADTHPEITFESSDVSKTDDGYDVKGNLNIKGISKIIMINFIRKDNKLIGYTTLFSSDFGIEIKKNREDNEVQIKLVFDLK